MHYAIKDEALSPTLPGLTDLTREGGASTFFRLFRSRHVADLRLLFGVVVVLFFVVGPMILWFHSKNESSLIGSPTLAAGVTAILLGAVSRIYQMGSVRLGIVDLFSCEIITICRVIAVVDTTHSLLALHDNPPPAARKFSSEENYSPIFNNNAKDLENLEARVVERVTEFYTYLKTMRDFLRHLADIEHPEQSREVWQETVRSSIYMLFLMLESARKSVNQLVEYQPELALYNAEILLSEIPAYSFLWDSFWKDSLQRPEHDARFQRLDLRRKDYRPIVRELNQSVRLHSAESDPEREAWSRVAALLNELNRACDGLERLTSPSVERKLAA